MQSTNSEILNHMGFLSTDFVVRWMSYYARLQPMTIVMKCFLHARNLNTNFKGMKIEMVCACLKVFYVILSVSARWYKFILSADLDHSLLQG